MKDGILPFVDCLESLPNLHTLELLGISVNDTALFRNALRDIQLPQINTLTLHCAARPLLEHCLELEDLVCVSSSFDVLSDDFFRSLTTNRDLKIRRLAIPLMWKEAARA
jgi:hypothetical protein